MTYYLKERTKEEAIKNIEEIIDYYYENADMALEFNQGSLMAKILFIASQIQSKEEIDEYMKTIFNKIKTYKGA